MDTKEAVSNPPLTEAELTKWEARTREDGGLAAEEALRLIAEVRRLQKLRREMLMSLVEQVRAGVPEEWSEEELLRRVEQAVAEVREERRARGESRQSLVPLASLWEEQQAKLARFQERVEQARAWEVWMSS